MLQRDDIDLPALLARYGRTGAPTRPMAGGSANWSWRVGENHVLTACVDAAPARAEVLAGLLEHLAAHGFPTNRLVRTVDGARCAVASGLPVLLKTRVPGRTLDPPTRADLPAIGASLARLHAVPAPADLPRDHLFGLPEAPLVLGSGVDPAFEAALGAALDRLRPLLAADLPRGLVHGDLFGDNILRDGEHLAFIDFEEASEAVCVADLGMAVLGLCVREEAPDPAAVAALVAGYEAVRPLTPAERALLPAMAALATWACASWRCWRNQISRPDPNAVERHRAPARLAPRLEALRLGP